MFVKSAVSLNTDPPAKAFNRCLHKAPGVPLLSLSSSISSHLNTPHATDSTTLLLEDALRLTAPQVYKQWQTTLQVSL